MLTWKSVVSGNTVLSGQRAMGLSGTFAIYKSGESFSLYLGGYRVTTAESYEAAVAHAEEMERLAVGLRRLDIQ